MIEDKDKTCFTIIPMVRCVRIITKKRSKISWHTPFKLQVVQNAHNRPTDYTTGLVAAVIIWPVWPFKPSFKECSTKLASPPPLIQSRDEKSFNGLQEKFNF